MANTLARRNGSETPTVPIGVIVGCTVAGLVLGVVVLIVWAFWERAAVRKRRRELVRNTASKPACLNAVAGPPISLPRPHSKVTFVTDKRATSSPKYDDESVVPCGDQLRGVWPGPHRPAARQMKASNLAPRTYLLTRPMGPPPVPGPRTIIHQPSTISSASAYSTESAEEHPDKVRVQSVEGQIRQQPHREGDRPRALRSARRQPSWVFIPRPFRQAGHQGRLSQASSASAYSQ